ncbi:hypothetical protein GE061_016659 [Apolygus lucorum]|uniref:Uncharacterized protein n=1 Tax=Apolygus lucorum TaxID=248454 RepID=A0A6A4JQI7_APOLU|nr:hypothetical protein GE061_016659 [Apolygus lucorum]
MADKWEPEHVNQSHPNLLSDVNFQDPEAFVTTMKADYGPPNVHSHPTARRKEMLKQFYWKQFSQEFFDQLGKMPCEEDNFANFSTTYEDQFGIEDFQPKNILDLVDPEQHAKYPLYADPPYSVYMEKIDRIKPSAKAKHPMHAFRRSSTFVRNWYDELE